MPPKRKSSDEGASAGSKHKVQRQYSRKPKNRNQVQDSNVIGTTTQSSSIGSETNPKLVPE